MRSPLVVVASRLVPSLWTHAAAQGVDVAALWSRHDLKPLPTEGGLPLPPSLDLSVERQIALFDDAASLLDDDILGARLGMAIPRGTFGLLEFAAHIGPDLQAVVDVTIETTPLVSPVARVELRVEEGADLAHFCHHVDVEGGYGRHPAEMSVAAIYAGGRRAVGDALVWSEVFFTHDAPSPSTQQRLAELFGCPVRFSAACNGFSFPTSMLRLPTRMHDDVLHGFLRAQAAREMAARPRGAMDPFTAQVADVVQRALTHRTSVEMAAVARTLAVSTRTLQRRLAERGTSLSRVLDHVREAEARRLLLATERRVEEVADALGFADVSAFGRAFRRWTGQSPTTWRQQLRRESEGTGER